MLWDRGTYDLIGDTDAMGQIARGDFKFHLRGEKLNGDFALVLMKNRGKGNEWLLLKKRDASAVEGWDVEAFAYSVLTGRTQEEIAHDLPARALPAREIPASTAAPPPEKRVEKEQLKKERRESGCPETQREAAGPRRGEILIPRIL